MAIKLPQAPLKILQDDREKTPFKFARVVDVEGVTVRRLDVADYTTERLLGVVAIERKSSANELASNSTQARFLAELERSRGLEALHLVCEFSLKSLLEYPYGSGLPTSVRDKIRVTGRFVVAKLMQWQYDYPHLRIHFADNPTSARDLTVAILRSAERRLLLPSPASNSPLVEAPE